MEEYFFKLFEVFEFEGFVRAIVGELFGVALFVGESEVLGLICDRKDCFGVGKDRHHAVGADYIDCLPRGEFIGLGFGICAHEEFFVGVYFIIHVASGDEFFGYGRAVDCAHVYDFVYKCAVDVEAEFIAEVEDVVDELDFVVGRDFAKGVVEVVEVAGIATVGEEVEAFVVLCADGVCRDFDAGDDFKADEFLEVRDLFIGAGGVVVGECNRVHFAVYRGGDDFARVEAPVTFRGVKV